MLSCQRHLFRIPDDVAYLNAATTGPMLAAAEDAGVEALKLKREPWRITPADTFIAPMEAVRTTFARLAGCAPECIALVPAVSYAMGVAAANLKLRQGQSVLVLDEQFPSHVYPWRNLALDAGGRLHTVARPADRDWTAAVLKALDADPSVAIAALPNCHWTDGTLVDLAAVGAKCREKGVSLAIDATQSFGALALDLDAVQPDFMAVAGHKWLLGPYSYTYLYVAPKHHNGLPLEENWLNRQGSENFARLVDYRDEYQPGAHRFDVGEASNFFLTPIAQATLNQIISWSVAEISSTLAAHTAAIADRARRMGMATAPDHLRGPHMLGLSLPPGAPQDLPAQLAKRNVFVSVRGSSIRVAPHMHTNSNDIDRLFEALQDVL